MCRAFTCTHITDRLLGKRSLCRRCGFLHCAEADTPTHRYPPPSVDIGARTDIHPPVPLPHLPSRTSACSCISARRRSRRYPRPPEREHRRAGGFWSAPAVFGAREYFPPEKDIGAPAPHRISERRMRPPCNRAFVWGAKNMLKLKNYQAKCWKAQ